MDQDRAKKAIQMAQELGNAFEEAVKESGSMGAPAGVLYAGCMNVLSLNTFEFIMGALVKVGRLTKKGNLYFLGPNATK